MTNLQIILKDANEAYYKLIKTEELHNTLNEICSNIKIPKVATIKDFNERTRKGLLIMLEKGLFN